ncbi:MAG: hypothetical protein ACRC0N_01260 [Acinetobacter johnsonii]
MKLTQAQYDQKMAEYTATVNSTKTVLDAKDNPATATEMKTAFCQRMDAYHQIAALSKANIELSTASVMLMVANRYLEQQEKSLTDAGMNESAFCPTAKALKVEDTKRLKSKVTE